MLSFSSLFTKCMLCLHNTVIWQRVLFTNLLHPYSTRQQPALWHIDPLHSSLSLPFNSTSMLRLGILEINLSSSVQVDRHALCHTQASVLWWLLKRIWWRRFLAACKLQKDPFFFKKKDLLVTMAITKINVTDSSWIAGRLSPSLSKYSVPELRAHFRVRAQTCTCSVFVCLHDALHTHPHSACVTKGNCRQLQKMGLKTFNINLRNKTFTSSHQMCRIWKDQDVQNTF